MGDGGCVCFTWRNNRDIGLSRCCWVQRNENWGVWVRARNKTNDMHVRYCYADCGGKPVPRWQSWLGTDFLPAGTEYTINRVCLPICPSAIQRSCAATASSTHKPLHNTCLLDVIPSSVSVQPPAHRWTQPLHNSQNIDENSFEPDLFTSFQEGDGALPLSRC